MAEVNYRSYDGDLYKVILRELAPEEASKYLRSIYKPKEALPIIIINRDSNSCSFFEFLKVDNESEADPIVIVGERKGRCPYCGEKKCLNSHIAGGIKFGLEKEEEDSKKINKEKGHHFRYINKCSNPKYAQNYYIVEYIYIIKNFYKMLKRKQCPYCKVYNSIRISDKSRYRSEFMNDFIKKLPPEQRDFINKTKFLEYRCKACSMIMSFSVHPDGGGYFDVPRTTWLA
ncbi:MAG: hypothetical protein V1762_02375 [Nitrospirota bacterium]